MLVIEILMVIIGLGAVIASFRLSDDSKETNDNKTEIDYAEIEEKIKQAVKETKEDILNKADEKFSQISNDKILGFSEYSDEVFNKIEKNHEETVFLYNMLTEKEKEIQKLVHSVDMTNADLRNEAAKTYQKVRKQLSEVDDVLKQIEIENAKGVSKVASGNTASNAGMMNRPVRPVVEESIIPPKPEKEVLHNNDFYRSNEIDMSAQTQIRSNSILDDAEVKAIAEITDARKKYIAQSENMFEKDNSEENKANSNNEIIALYKKGRSVLEISKMLSIGQGEVKLVIDLYNAR